MATTDYDAMELIGSPEPEGKRPGRVRDRQGKGVREVAVTLEAWKRMRAETPDLHVVAVGNG